MRSLKALISKRTIHRAHVNTKEIMYLIHCGNLLDEQKLIDFGFPIVISNYGDILFVLTKAEVHDYVKNGSIGYFDIYASKKPVTKDWIIDNVKIFYMMDLLKMGFEIAILNEI